MCRKINRRPIKQFTIRSFAYGVDATEDPLTGEEGSAAVCYNFDTSGGALKDGKGLRRSEIFPMGTFSAIACAERFYEWMDKPQYYVVGVNGIGSLTYQAVLDNGSYDAFMVTSAPYLTGKTQVVPYVLNDFPSLLFCNKTQGLAHWRPEQPAITVVEGAPRITSMAVHAERLFATVDGRADTVWFSDDLDPTNWQLSLDGAGFIRLTGERGNCEKVVSFGGCLYVFRSFGITRITAYGDQTEFTVTDLFTAGGKICPQSIAVCGNRILFLSSDGLFSFDGTSAVRIAPKIAPLFRQTGLETAAFWKGKYYLSTGADLDGMTGSDGNNLLLEYDVYSKKVNMYYGLDVRGLYGLTQIDKFFVLLSDGKPYEFCEQAGIDGAPLSRKWQTNLSALGSHRKKVLRTVSFFLDGKCDLEIICDGKTRSYRDLTCDGGSVEIPIHLSGKAFSIAITSNAERCTVARLTVTYC